MYQWQAVDKTSDIGSETVVRTLILALQLDGTTPVIILRVVEINQADVACVGQFSIKLTPEVIVVGNTNLLTQFLLYLGVSYLGIEAV